MCVCAKRQRRVECRRFCAYSMHTGIARVLLLRLCCCCCCGLLADACLPACLPAAGRLDGWRVSLRHGAAVRSSHSSFCTWPLARLARKLLGSPRFAFRLQHSLQTPRRLSKEIACVRTVGLTLAC